MYVSVCIIHNLLYRTRSCNSYLSYVYRNLKCYDTRWKNPSCIVKTHYDTNIEQRFIYFHNVYKYFCLIKFLKLHLSKNNRRANNRSYEVVYFFASVQVKASCNLPSDIELATQSAIDTLIPAKDKERYEIVYKYL
jgi:hypothetical protein